MRIADQLKKMAGKTVAALAVLAGIAILLDFTNFKVLSEITLKWGFGIN